MGQAFMHREAVAVGEEVSAFIRASDAYHGEPEYYVILGKAEKGASPETSRALVDFLRGWGGLARNLPGEGRQRESLEKSMTDWMRQNRKTLDELGRSAIQSADFDEIGGRLAGLFDSLTGIARGFGSTATGKTLHILLPRLCVLWDGKYVRDTQGYDEDGQGYVEYLKSRQVILHDAIEAAKQPTDEADVDSIVRRLQEQHANRWADCSPPITKLLDEINYDESPAWQHYLKSARHRSGPGPEKHPGRATE